MVRRRAKSTAWHLALPVVGALVAGCVLVEATALAQVIGTIWFGLGAVAFVFAGKGMRRA